MAKIMLFPVLLAVACLVAGAYGALHNQISYTVSPDYFHAFKFDQFDIAEHLRGRVGAAIVGWRASWWMGLFVGWPVLLVVLVMPDARSYVMKSLTATPVVVLTTLAIGLLALAYASCTITEANLPEWSHRKVDDPVAFARAGTMHNFSYLGGLVGVVTASAYLIFARARLGKSGPFELH